MKHRNCPGIARLLIIAALIVLFAPEEASSDDPEAVLEVGVLPYLNLKALFEAYGPLIDHLDANVDKPVRLVTARDYPHLLELTAEKAYPLLITGSHFARKAQLETGYEPILRPLTSYREMVLVPEDSPIAAMCELRGEIAVPSRFAQTTMMGLATLSDHGACFGSKIEPVSAGGHVNAIHTALQGEAAAAIVSEGAYRHMDNELRSRVRVLEPDRSRVERVERGIPVIFTVSPDISSKRAEFYQETIADFANNHPEGRAWIDNLGYEGLRPPSAEEMASLDRHVEQLQLIMDSLEDD